MLELSMSMFLWILEWFKIHKTINKNQLVNWIIILNRYFLYDSTVYHWSDKILGIILQDNESCNEVFLFEKMNPVIYLFLYRINNWRNIE